MRAFRGASPVVPPLSQQLRFAARDGLAGFTVAAPPSAGLRPAGGAEVMKVELPKGAALLVVVFPDLPPDADAAIAALRAGLRGRRIGETRDGRVGPTPARVVDVALTFRHLREHRFVHGGVVWGAGVVTRHDDRLALATAAAMLATWRWAA